MPSSPNPIRPVQSLSLLFAVIVAHVGFLAAGAPLLTLPLLVVVVGALAIALSMLVERRDRSSLPLKSRSRKEHL